MANHKGCLPPPKFPPLPRLTLEELLPDQKEMDKLASALTEAVLQLRAGDMEGARTTLNDADGLCDVRIHGVYPLPSNHQLDALRYGMGVAEHIYQQPPEHVMTATEQLLRQQVVEQHIRRIIDEVDPTDPGV